MSIRSRLAWSFVFVLMLSACGGGSGGGDATDGGNKSPGDLNEPETQEAVLLDGIVVGVIYDAGDGVTGTTDARGVFRFRPGNSVEFFIGKLSLGSARPVPRVAAMGALAADQVVTPFELAGEGASFGDPAVLNRVRLLMALDADGDAANGISIATKTHEAISLAVTIDYAAEMDAATLIQAGVPLAETANSLPAPDAARAHFCRSLGRAECDDKLTAPEIGAANPPAEKGEGDTPLSVGGSGGGGEPGPDEGFRPPEVPTVALPTVPTEPSAPTAPGTSPTAPTPTVPSMPSEPPTPKAPTAPISKPVKPVPLVGPPVELAAAFGIATQGSTYSPSYTAAQALDGDPETFNHTTCYADVNWWQVKLPRTTTVARVEILSRNSNVSRLADASVSLSTVSRAAGPDPSMKLGTLAGTSDLQVLETDEPIPVRHVIVETEGNACLHLAEVRVFGHTSQAPVFDREAEELSIAPDSKPGTVIGTIGVKDYQGDPVTLGISDISAPFRIKADGQLTLTETIDHNVEREWRFDVEASDGVNRSSIGVHVTLGGGRGALVERWNDADGYPTGPGDAAPYTVPPDRVFNTDRIALGSDGDRYRQRLRSVLVPETTGERVFALAADDTATLWLTPAGLDGKPVQVVSQKRYTNAGDWSNSAVSEPVALEAGRGYHLTVLHVENGGGDHVALGWKRPDEAAFVPVPRSVLYVDALSAGFVEPSIVASRASTLLSGTARHGEVVASVSAFDPQGDKLALYIDADVPFSVDASGRVTVSGPLVTGARYTFDVGASDGTHRATTTIIVDTTADTALAQALATGDASGVTTGEIVDAIAATAEGLRTSREQLYRALFGIDGTGATVEDTGVSLSSLDWTLNHDAVFYESTDPGGNHPVLISNTTYKSDTASSLEVPLAMAGIAQNGARHAALGSNLLAGVGAPNEALQTVTGRLLAWLVKRDVATLPDAALNIVVAHQTNSYYFRHDKATHAWFTDRYPSFSVNAIDACDNNALDGCLATADLLVIGLDEPTLNGGFDAETTMNAVRAARARGVPLLFLQADGGLNTLGQAMMNELGLVTTDNYWFKEQLAGFDPASLVERTFDNDALIEAIANIEGGRIDVVYDADTCTNSVGTVTCHPESMNNAWGGTLQTSVFDGIEYLRTAFAALDEQGVDVFELGTGHRLLKLAALLGDHHRERIRYPMDKATTDATTFYRALFGDYAINYARAGNRTQVDMGTFTGAQALLAASPGLTRALALTPEHESGWTSTGLYVPPGRSVTVRRTDNASTKMSVKVNFLRHSTRIWNTNGYTRPRYVTSRDIDIGAGDSVAFSTPYGGPLYVWLDGVEGPPQPLSIEVIGVLDNPLLDGVESTDIAGFLTDTEGTDSDWVDLSTPYVEIHSLKRHMLSSFSDQDGDSADGYDLTDVQDYVADLNDYLIAGNYSLAGYTGEGLPALRNEVVAWCTGSGFDSFYYDGETRDLCTDPALHPKRRKQHVNSDVSAQCGSLCAGNPFDSSYAIGPLGWGENHEMGHNLQRHRLKIYGGRSGEVSNNVFPIHTLWRWTLDQGLDRHPSGRGGDHAGAFAQLQAAIADGTPANEAHPTWSDTGTYANNAPRLAFFEQLVWTHGSWSIYTKMYLLERLFTDAIRSDERWAELGAALGFDGYTRKQAMAISGNDFMYIAASRIEGRDYRDLFNAWGIEVSAAAHAQVAGYGLAERVPAALYYSALPVTAALPAEADLVPLDGVSAWVDPTP